jgi:hypothetical protein
LPRGQREDMIRLATRITLRVIESFQPRMSLDLDGASAPDAVGIELARQILTTMCTIQASVQLSRYPSETEVLNWVVCLSVLPVSLSQPRNFLGLDLSLSCTLWSLKCMGVEIAGFLSD